MKVWKKLSFRLKTWLSLGLLFIISTLTMIYSIFTIRYISSSYENDVLKGLKIKDEVRIILTDVLKARKNEKYYIIRGDDKYLSLYDHDIKDVLKHTTYLSNLNSNVIEKKDIDLIVKEINSYKDGFYRVVETIKAEKQKKEILKKYSNQVLKNISKNELPNFVLSSFYYIVNAKSNYFLERSQEIRDEVKRKTIEVVSLVKKEMINRKSSSKAIESMVKSLELYKNTFTEISSNYEIREKLISDYEKVILDLEKVVEKEVSATDSHVERRLSELMELKKKIILMSIISAVLTLSIIIIIAIFYITSSRRVEIFISQLTKDVESSNNGSKQLESLSDELSSGVNEQSSAILETVSTLDEMKEMMRKSFENIEYSDKKADEGQKTARQGKESVSKVLISIDAISKCNEDITSQMSELSQELNQIVDAIKDISQKTEVINDIVFQTKLLSFNASVEAARAGEHGKGFAVVAEEVGNLASMSGKAASEIEGLIGQSVDKVERIVASSKTKVDGLVSIAKDKTRDGIERVNDCDNVLTSLVSNVSEMKSLMSSVSEAAKEQSTGVDNISQAMNELDQATHMNTEVANRTSFYAKEISAQSSGLSDVVHSLESIFLGYVKRAEKIESTVLANNTKSDKSLSNHIDEKSSVLPSRDDERFEDI